MTTPREEFAGRVAASVDADPPRVVVILGEDGSGRTSLLHHLAAARGAPRCQYIDCERLTSTPERFVAGLVEETPFRLPDDARAGAGPVAAFDRLFDVLGRARTRDGGPATFLFDEWLEIQTFEHFPGLRHCVATAFARLAQSTNRFVLTTRFVARALRQLETASNRIVPLSMPAIETPDIAADLNRVPGLRADTAGEFAPIILALTGGRAAYVRALVDTLAAAPSLGDPVSALVATMAPDGVIDRRCRRTYETRLQRARGYGTLKAILAVLAREEPLTLTEIAVRIGRTPGSTRDYLGWIEDVDLVAAHRKQYAIADPLLRVWVDLYDRPSPPGGPILADVVRRYAQDRLARAAATRP